MIHKFTLGDDTHERNNASKKPSTNKLLATRLFVSQLRARSAMSMKLTLSPEFSFGLAAVLLSFAINAATQEPPDPSRIVASIYDGSEDTRRSRRAVRILRDRQATLSKALKTLWDKADAAAKTCHYAKIGSLTGMLRPIHRA